MYVYIYTCVYIKAFYVFFFFQNKYNFAIKIIVPFDEYHFREIRKSQGTRATVNHKHEKVKDEIYLVSTDAPQRNISFRKFEAAYAYLFVVVFASIRTRRVITLIFIIFFLTYSGESVYLCIYRTLQPARKKGHFTRYHSLP